MALIKLLTAVGFLVALATAQSTLGNKAAAPAKYQQPPLAVGVVDFLRQQQQQQQREFEPSPAAPTLGLELPRPEQGRPFYEADYTYRGQPSADSGAPIYSEKLPTEQDYWTILGATEDAKPETDLRAPIDYELPNVKYFDLPVPAQDLIPPVSQWNPDNDPTLYYALPVEITKETVPTNSHPKKYHKDVFEKVKPISSKPKEEISLIPVSEKDLIDAEKQAQKTAYNQAKVEHHRLLESEKLQQQQQQPQRTEEEDEQEQTRETV